MRRISIRLGLFLESIGTMTGLLLLFLAQDSSNSILSNSFLIFISMLFLWYFPHCLLHYVIGKLFKINFLYFRIAPSNLIKSSPNLYFTKLIKIFPVLGLSVDKNGLSSINYIHLILMYSSGVIGSMLFPLIISIYAFITLLFPYYLPHIFFSLSNIVITLFFSPKFGDFYRARLVLSKKTV